MKLKYTLHLYHLGHWTYVERMQGIIVLYTLCTFFALCLGRCTLLKKGSHKIRYFAHKLNSNLHYLYFPLHFLKYFCIKQNRNILYFNFTIFAIVILSLLQTLHIKMKFSIKNLFSKCDQICGFGHVC